MTPATSTTTGEIVNIAGRLSQTARLVPDQTAVVEPEPRRRQGQRKYRTMTFAELDRDSDHLAAGLCRQGVQRGTRIALLVRPGIDFISLTFALFKTGAVIILIDPGMGRANLLQCLQDAKPAGFVAIPVVHMVRALTRRFPQARILVTAGRRWFWGGTTVDRIRQQPASDFQLAPTQTDDDAAIIFTTGSTGPPKGVLYSHGNFSTQVEQIRDRYGISPGGSDLAGFPLFALFNAAMATTTVIPDMDPTRPAQVDPANIIEAIQDWKIDQSFGSPAIWNAVGKYCTERSIQLPTIRRVLSAGAPVPPHVLRWMKDTIAADGEMYTPYGATEALPVASISASQVLDETAARTATGGGTCVGEKFSQIQWRVIRVEDGPIRQIEDVLEMPRGEIGELIVSGPVVTRRYVTRIEANARAKIADGDAVWHRMGDVGYLDEQDRFWFCGRMAHRVQTATGTMFTVRCEAIYNQHPRIFRSALVGIGSPGTQQPVMICEPWLEKRPQTKADGRQLCAELAALGQQSPLTENILPQHVLLHESMPVDIRHNAKIFREKLAVWAADELGRRE